MCVQKLVLSVVAVLASMWGAQGFGLPTDSTSYGTEVIVGSCKVERDFENSGATGVFLVIEGSRRFAGGFMYEDRDLIDERPVITESDMSTCFDDYIAGSLVQQSVVAASFAAQSNMGFGYRSNNGNWVPYVVGSGTLEPQSADAPTELVATPGDEEISLGFLPPANTGDSAITDYEYQLEDGSWVSSGVSVSPVIISGLINDVPYRIKLRAVTSPAAGAGTETIAVISTPAALEPLQLASSIPSDNATDVAIDQDIVLTFSDDVSLQPNALALYDSSNSEISTAVTVSGPNVTISPTSNLNYSAGYYIKVSANAVEQSNETIPAFAGIADKTTLNFTTAASPLLDDSRSVDEVFGNNGCIISKYFSSGEQSAWVYLDTGASILYDSNAGYWDTGSKKQSGSPLDKFVIATCLGTQGENIAGLVQKGADASSFGEQEYMGFAFTLLKESGSLGVGLHEYFVGSAPATVTTPSVPTNFGAIGGNGEITVSFASPVSNGGASISDYQYEIDGNETWISIGTTASPFVIPGLDVGEGYAVKLRAVNSIGYGLETDAVTSTTLSKPTAPTDLIPSAGDRQVTLAFTEPSDNGGSGITDYEYELDNSGTIVSAGIVTSPLVITDLINGRTYSIRLRARNSVGGGIVSEAVTFTTSAAHSPLTNSAPVANAGPDETVASAAAVTLDGSGSSDADSGDTLTYAWTQTSGTTVTLSSATVQQPTFTAPTLNLGDADAVLEFSLVVNDGTVNSVADTVTITVEAPTNSAPVADAGSDQKVASAAAVTLDGSGSSDADTGDTLTYAWTQTSGATVTLSSATAQQPTFTAPTLNVGDADAVLVFSLVVNDGTVNSVADTVTITVEAPAPTPASEFAEHEAEIRNTLVGDASRSLRSSVSANQRMTQSARGRFISARQTKAREEDVTRALIPFDVDGNFTLSESGLNTSGNFFQQVGNEEGTYRRLFFGDFDVQHDNDTDSTTATLTGRMAWEQMTSEQTMLGYFIGGELATSTIGGSFEGDQDRIGVTAGGYVVHELSEQVYFDGFASVGAGRNNLEMANHTLALESEYTTQTGTLGGAITGVYSQKGYDFKPELAFSYGKTWLGDIGFTGRAYGLVDNTLSLDAGDVSIASLTFRPEVIVPIGADFVADSNTHFTYAPRLICEQIKSTTKTSDCGTGGELGFSSTSEDGLSSADMRVLLDRINGGTRSSFAFSVEHKF